MGQIYESQLYAIHFDRLIKNRIGSCKYNSNGEKMEYLMMFNRDQETSNLCVIESYIYTGMEHL